jgi:NAD(P)-dependent dehydrogenase (short-subunit alcohol dehydrogenase family)
MFEAGLLRGERILVTGGGTGLGRAMAERFAALGASVIICGRRGEVLEKTAAELRAASGASIETHVVDIRVAGAVEEMVDKAWQAGPVTALVNNAAGNFISRTEDLSSRAFDAIAGIVFHGTFYVTLAMGKKWIEAKLPGSVVSIIVTWVRNGGPFVVPSAMSKAGVDVMTKSLAAEWGRYGIRLNAIAPGTIPTEGMWNRLGPGRDIEEVAQRNPMRRNGTLAELQNLATFLLAPQGSPWINGETIAMDGGGALANGGGFYADLMKLGDAEWQQIREMIRGQNAKDKGQRGA